MSGTAARLYYDDRFDDARVDFVENASTAADEERFFEPAPRRAALHRRACDGARVKGDDFAAASSTSRETRPVLRPARRCSAAT